MGISSVNLVSWPLPGTSTLSVFDRITILNAVLPVQRIDAGVELDIEKRKEPGSDWSSYVSHGIDATPISITLLLFRDLTSGKNYFAEYEQIKDRLISKFLARRNAIPVYNILLDAEGINEIVFTKKTIYQPVRGQIFSVTLQGFSPKTLRIGSAGASKTVEQDKQLTSRATAKQAPANVITPSANQRGRATRPR